jgi:hypothetical protein
METNEILKGVAITLSKEVSEEFFYNSLCNALGTGYMSGYGLELHTDENEYKQSKNNWQEKNPNQTCCYEDVLMQMLRDGYKLTFIDNECEGEYNRSITLKDVHEKVQKVPVNFLNDMIQQNDDAETADVILQTVFFDEIIFG